MKCKDGTSQGILQGSVIKDTENPATVVQDRLDYLLAILKGLNLNINMSKTKIQIFPRSNRIDNIRNIPLYIQGKHVIVKSEQTAKYLGKIIDKNLNFVEHKEMVRGKVKKRKNVVKYLMNRMNATHPWTNINIIKSLTLPVIYYGSSVLGW